MPTGCPQDSVQVAERSTKCAVLWYSVSHHVASQIHILNQHFGWLWSASLHCCCYESRQFSCLTIQGPIDSYDIHMWPPISEIKPFQIPFDPILQTQTFRHFRSEAFARRTLPSLPCRWEVALGLRMEPRIREFSWRWHTLSILKSFYRFMWVRSFRISVHVVSSWVTGR